MHRWFGVIRTSVDATSPGHFQTTKHVQISYTAPNLFLSLLATCNAAATTDSNASDHNSLQNFNSI